MSESLIDARLRETGGPKKSGLTLAVLCGSLSGAIIGAGMSVGMGLFLGNSSLFISVVIGVSMVLGAFLGHVIAGLLAENAPLKPYGDRYERELRLPGDVVTGLYDHQQLKKSIEYKNVINHMNISSSSSTRATREMLPPYSPDAELFETIVTRTQSR